MYTNFVHTEVVFIHLIKINLGIMLSSGCNWWIWTKSKFRWQPSHYHSAPESGEVKLVDGQKQFSIMHLLHIPHTHTQTNSSLILNFLHLLDFIHISNYDTLKLLISSKAGSNTNAQS